MTDDRSALADRAPGLAAASIFLGLSVIAIQIRMEEPWSDGALFAVAVAGLVVAYALALLAPSPFDRPAVSTSVLIVVALLLAPAALLQLARVIGVDDPTAPGTLTWIAAVYTLLAGVLATRRESATAALLCAGGITGFVLAGAQWLFDLEGDNTFRYLLAGLVVVFFLAGLTIGGSRPRHGVVLVDAAGLAAILLGVLLVGTFFFGVLSGDSDLAWGWELTELLMGVALVSYSVSQREAGPGYLGAIVLAIFVFGAAISLDDKPTLVGWPLALLIVGALILAATLRPRPRR
jgi:hypothetical protein